MKHRDVVGAGSTVVTLLSLAIAGCANSPIGGDPTIEHHRGVVIEADGRYAFYAGQGVGDILAKGQIIPDDHPSPFMRLRVLADFVAAAAADNDRVKTASFEMSDSSIEVTVHSVRQTTLETLIFHPGDPWITGYAQVATGLDGYTMGLFDVTKWTHGAPGMPTVLAQSIYTTGLMADDVMPTLKYGGDMATWPPLPADWR
jgi:hypothetical protein